EAGHGRVLAVDEAQTHAADRLVLVRELHRREERELHRRLVLREDAPGHRGKHEEEREAVDGESHVTSSERGGTGRPAHRAPAYIVLVRRAGGSWLFSASLGD